MADNELKVGQPVAARNNPDVAGNVTAILIDGDDPLLLVSTSMGTIRRRASELQPATDDKSWPPDLETKTTP